MMKKAFTLAEILITLGIIGVVAAMTIPTLMSNTGKAEFTTAYKKIISAVNQAVTMSVAIDYIDFGDANTGTVTDSIYGILSKKMQIAKTVVGTNDEVCRMFKDTNNSCDSSVATNYTLFFADGMAISYPQAAAKCTTALYNNTTNASRANCKAIVDVNGSKGPNKLSHCDWGDGQDPNKDTDASTGDNDLCTEENAYIADHFSVMFKGQQLVPNGNAARYVLYEK